MPEAAEAAGRLRRLLGGARTRILAAFVILMAFSTVVSVFAINELLLVRTSERVNASLRQEVDEFRQLAGGIDPRTGERFGDDLEGIFRLYRDRNVPGEGETVVMFVGGRVFDTLSGTLGGRVSFDGGTAARWSRLQQTEGGELETPAGTTERYLAVPVTRRNGRCPGRVRHSRLAERRVGGGQRRGPAGGDRARDRAADRLGAGLGGRRPHPRAAAGAPGHHPGDHGDRPLPSHPGFRP